MDATIALTLIEGLLILLAIATNKALRFLYPSLHVVHQISRKGEDASVSTVSSSDRIAVGDSPPATKYDVFLSFRGEDTRNNFASYLYEALCKENIQTFMDHKLHKGDDISPILLRTIQESEISVIIFSVDYASSTWCLDELVHILECKKKFGRVVVPIFYKVDPSNVSKQSGSFGDGFAKLRQRFTDNPERLHKWKNALIQSTSLPCRWDSKSIRPETKFIKEVVKDILSKLKYCTSSCHVEGLVGINHQIEKIEELLTDARILGIWGPGGIGKTTLAKALFGKLKSQFEASSFVGNVREQLARNGVEKLQEQCLKELLKDEGLHIYNMRSTFVKHRLQRKKILLILDDVDNLLTAEDLTKLCDWFGEGSRIIVTSRDMQVLKNSSASTTYQVKELEFNDALNLFSLKAFKQNEPFKGYLELSKLVVSHYCQGNPLALVVLGCFLYGRTKPVWESALEKLKQAPHKDIFSILKVSFDGLDEMQKNVFLDLTIFLKGGAWRVSLDCLRSLYGSSAYIDICVLKERSLILVNENGDIEMHALLMDMGLEISRQQFISNPEKPIRLWRHEDVYRFFNNDKATVEAVRCVSLDMSKMKMIKWRSSDFRKMHKLIFLRIYKSDQRRKPSKLNLFGHLDYLPEELRFFSWEEYPLPYVPLHFCAENLVILGMLNSTIQQLGNGTQHFPNLKRMDVQYSKDLTAVPDLCHIPKVEKMCLDGCVSLAHIHYSSNVSRRNVTLYIQDSRPLEMDIEGIFKMQGLSPSGFEIVRSYSLDGCDNVSMKVEVRGKIMSGLGFKHVEENAELRQRLECLLPYVKRVEWSESAIDDFNQHYNYHLHYTDPFYSLATDNDLPLTTQVAATATTMATTTTSMEYYDSNNSVTLTRYRSSITPKELMNYREPLNKNIPRDLILKALYYGYSRQCRRTNRSSGAGWKNLSP